MIPRANVWHALCLKRMHMSVNKPHQRERAEVTMLDSKSVELDGAKDLREENVQSGIPFPANREIGLTASLDDRAHEVLLENLLAIQMDSTALTLPRDAFRGLKKRLKDCQLDILL